MKQRILRLLQCILNFIDGEDAFVSCEYLEYLKSLNDDEKTGVLAKLYELKQLKMKQRMLEFIQENKSFYLQDLLEVLLKEGYTIREADGTIYSRTAREYLYDLKKEGLIKYERKGNKNLYNSLIISTFT